MATWMASSEPASSSMNRPSACRDVSFPISTGLRAALAAATTPARGPASAPRQQADHEDRARADDRPDDAVAGRAGDPDEVGDGEHERVQRRELGGRHVHAALQQLAGAHVAVAVGQHTRQQVVRLAVTDER